MKKETICNYCNTTFESYKKEERKFCSQSCSAKSSNTKRKQFSTCLFCSAQISKKKKYCNNKCQQLLARRNRIENCEASERTWKVFLIEELGHKCQICNNDTWNQKPIPLELDHIDGDSLNNTRENLRIICPNCHAQTSTYKSRNKGNGRVLRMERYKSGLSY